MIRIEIEWTEILAMLAVYATIVILRAAISKWMQK